LLILRRIITVIIAVIVTIVALVGGYLIYLNVNSARLPDKDEIGVSEILAGGADERAAEDASVPRLQAGQTYRAITFNIGFGANDRAYSFFMSEGRTVEGDSTKGLMSRATDEDAVKRNMEAAISAALGQRPDIAIFQEVDRDAGRSYKVDEFRMISRAFGEMAGASGDEKGAFAEAYATNFHTGWLLWPPARPMGMVKDSGIATYSAYEVNSAERLSLPVIESFPHKFFDLDRCFMVTRFPVSGADAGENPGSADAEGELVVINVHLSTFESGNKVHGEQLKRLAEVMEEEAAKGNWVIVGGDWNQCFPGSADAFTGRMETPSWAKPLDEAALPEGFSLVTADNADVVATCRDSSIPWTPGVSYETIIDGWIVSENVSAASENVDAGYEASDHNPVSLTFTLST
jgi:endonuclease/exonuclease/phosphatase family metal-dependent hydrolase